ncbi:RT0821/Lpp0805 family surface protein [Pseudochelatococcus sp. B33]
MMKLSSRMYRFIVSCAQRRSALRGPVVQSMRVVLLAGALGGGLSACSIAVPMGGVLGKADNLTTQSLAPAGAAGLSPELTPDDWNFASIALATALDPLGSGEVAPWANPRTGIRGDFVASGKPYLRDDLVCRSFRATLQYQGGNEVLDGAACRMPDGQWSTLSAAPA